jgi:predicted acetyltransferase
MSDSYPIRPIDKSELSVFGRVATTAFASTWSPDEMLELDLMVFEAERSLAAFDGDQPVGTAVAYSFGMTVPGGAVDAAGVSFVAVLPSHRRRGVLSALMTRQLADVAAGHEPVAVLLSSEAAIYGRFGYGAATRDLAYEIRRGEGLPRPPATAGQAPRLRLAEPKEAVKDLKAVYDAVLAGRPGMLTRNEAWWNRSLVDKEFMRDGRSPLRCVIAADDTGPRGYALYAAKPHWDSDRIPNGELAVYELHATDTAASAALWTDLLSRDLMGTVIARGRPIDDPLLHQLTDPRRLRASITDGLWVRLVDLPAALCARRYACPVDLVIDVTDDLLPANAGRWRLTAGGLADQGVPQCERSTANADLSLDVSALGAAYLGGARLGALAMAGLVGERRPGAVAALSAAMWWDPAPWSPMDF